MLCLIFCLESPAATGFFLIKMAKNRNNSHAQDYKTDQNKSLQDLSEKKNGEEKYKQSNIRICCNEGHIRLFY